MRKVDPHVFKTKIEILNIVSGDVIDVYWLAEGSGGYSGMFWWGWGCPDDVPTPLPDFFTLFQTNQPKLQHSPYPE